MQQTMGATEQQLADHQFCRDLDHPHLESLLGCASKVKFEPGEAIFRIGEPANTFYLIQRGRVAVEVPAHGGRPISIQTLGENSVLGWSWLISPYQWRFDARAIEATEAIALDGRCLRGKTEEDHDLGYALLKRFSAVMAERLEATRIQLLDIYGVTHD